MTWKKFSDEKPNEGIYLITRGVGYQKKGSCIENWENWKDENLSINPPLTHWWDGEPNFELAVENWK